MGPVKVIAFVPVTQQVVYFVQAVEPVQVQAFPSHGSVESFDDSVLSWFAGLNKPDFYPVRCLVLKQRTYKLRTIIAADIPGQSA